MSSLWFGCSSRELARALVANNLWEPSFACLLPWITVATAVFNRHTWLCGAGMNGDSQTLLLF